MQQVTKRGERIFGEIREKQGETTYYVFFYCVSLPPPPLECKLDSLIRTRVLCLFTVLPLVSGKMTGP